MAAPPGGAAAGGGVCVWIVGAEVAEPRDIAVRDFWQSYFEAAGADFDERRYGYSAVRVPERGC